MLFMNYSIFWARLLGFYIVILCAWTFLNIKDLHSMLTDLTSNHGVSMAVGFFTLFLGLAIAVSHSIWRGWPIVVTLVGYWIIIKGSVFLFFPHFINNIVAYWQGKNMMFAPIPAFVIGLYLLYCGYFCQRKV